MKTVTTVTVGSHELAARMNSSCARGFFALILAQALHSAEEIRFRLYEVFAPARSVASLISDDPARGFFLGNCLLVSFGLWCYFARVRVGHPSATSWMWFWVVLETLNGVGHPAIALARGGYFPGVVTAPLLFGFAMYLGTKLSHDECEGSREKEEGRGAS